MSFFIIRIQYLSYAIFIFLFTSCIKKEINTIKPSIIPVPVVQNIQDGVFELDNSITFNSEEVFKPAADFLKSYIENGSLIKLNTEASNTKSILFIVDESIENIEGYKLTVTSKKIIISAKNLKGAFWGVQTLRQLFPPCFENNSCGDFIVGIQAIKIEDEPKFKYRGMHLDVVRHMFSVNFIKKYIDMLSLLKMNTFHWHLTDDQGWRIEIKKYPKLGTHAAFRKETLVGHGSEKPFRYDGKPYGGIYTQNEIKDIVAYATSRGITVIPEIELPGHSQAAISAYPELGCTGQDVEVATRWGVFEDIYCTKEGTFKFIEDVLDEVIELFPSKYIHIGGDEAPKTRWKECAYCQSVIIKKGLHDEHELQNYFISRIEKYLNNKGRQIIGWDEILEGGIAPNATVMSWRGDKSTISAAKQKHDVIVTTREYNYFNRYQSKSKTEPLAIGGYLPLEMVYNINPIPKELNENEMKYVIGAQGNVWTEYIKTSEDVEYMVFPRAIALSEVLWSKDEQKSYSDFLSRLTSFKKRMDVIGVNYSKHIDRLDKSDFKK